MLFKRKIDPQNCSLIEFAYLQTGSYRKAARVVAFVVAWRVVRDDLERAPTMEEYAEYWKVSAASAYREQAQFREVFDRCDDPGPVLELQERREAERVSFGDLAEAV